jgi:hypothetical protein
MVEAMNSTHDPGCNCDRCNGTYDRNELAEIRERLARFAEKERRAELDRKIIACAAHLGDKR